MSSLSTLRLTWKFAHLQGFAAPQLTLTGKLNGREVFSLERQFPWVSYKQPLWAFVNSEKRKQYHDFPRDRLYSTLEALLPPLVVALELPPLEQDILEREAYLLEPRVFSALHHQPLTGSHVDKVTCPSRPISW